MFAPQTSLVPVPAITLSRALRPATLLALAGCAAAASGGDATPAQREVITRAEIEATPVTNAFELVRRLRPEFLQPYRRVPSQLAPDTQRFATVYVDGVRWGDIRALERLYVADLAEIRYLNGPDATTRFGIGHAAGAILVKTRQG